MTRYLIYDNDNGVGAYLLKEDVDIEEFAQELVDELGDDPASGDVNVFVIDVDNPKDVGWLPVVFRVWKEEWDG